MAEERAETPIEEEEKPQAEATEPGPAGKGLARVREWVTGLIRICPTPLLLGIGAGAIFALAALVAVVPFALGLDQNDLENLGLPGVFIANFLGTATLFFPVPGLTAGGQLLIVTLADRYDPVSVALLGGSGMALAETTAYGAGRGLRGLSSERKMPIGGRIGRWMEAAARRVDRLMVSHGVLTLFVLSAVPNPLFEFAGITAGAVRMPFWRFFAPVAVGKLLRAFALAFIGQALLDVINP